MPPPPSRYADVGADVALTARTEADLDEVAEAVRARGRRALVLPGDVNDLDHLAAVVDRHRRRARPRSTCWSTTPAGRSRSRSSTPRSPQLESSFHFNVSAAFELGRLAVPHMLDASAAASIVNIGSVAGRNAGRGTLTHCAHQGRRRPAHPADGRRPGAAGAGERGAARCGRDRGPAPLRARRGPRADGRAHRRCAATALPEDIARAVLFLASPAASWITGKSLEVDGLAGEDLVPKDIPDL